MLDMKQFAVVLIAASLYGCAVDEEDSAAGLGSFEEFEARVPRHPTLPGVYIVEGDIKMTEADLRAYYEELSSVESRAWTRHSGGIHQIYNTDTRLRLTYCVSSNSVVDFTQAEHDALVVAMREASLDWEAAADVQFIHMPAEDANCVNSNSNVWFRVIRWQNPPPNTCGMSAFLAGPLVFPNLRQVEISPNAVFGCPSASNVELLRHELGHVLGFRHEQMRHPNNANDPGFGCPDPGNFADQVYLSEFDPWSIMYYDHCFGSEGTHSFLTRRDAAGVRFLYNLPRAGWLRSSAGVAMPQWSDFNADLRADLYWYTPSGSLGDTFLFGQANGTLSTSASATPAPTDMHKPLVGQLSPDSRSDLFLYTQGTSPGNDLLFQKQAGNFAFTSIAHTVQDGLNIPLLGQFAGSDKTDIAFITPFGSGRLWVSEPNGTFSEHLFVAILQFPPATKWFTPVSGDFDGDGFSDIFLYNSDVDTFATSERSMLLRSQGDGTFLVSNVAHTQKGVAGTNESAYFYTMTTGDFNGDGSHDILFYSPTKPGPNSVFWKNGPGMAEFTITKHMPGRFKVFSGDFNGDELTDIFWYNQAVNGGPSTVWLMQPNFAATSVSVSVSHAELLPVPGDFDGDGDTDIYWFDPIGTDLVWRSNGDGTFALAQQLSPGPAGYPVGYGLQ